MSDKKKTIFEYDNYRNFLRDFYLSSKAENKKFSFRYFSRISGFQSSNFLNLVMKGECHLAEESIERLAIAMKLNKEESSFFKNLVLFNKAKTSEGKQRYAKELLRSRTYKKIHPLHDSQYDFFAKWYFAAIRSLVGLLHFKEDPHWISKQVNPTILPNEAKRALDELQKLGLIARDSQGRLVQTSANISTSDEVTSVSGIQHHREMMKRASESIDTVARENRDLSTMTLGVSVEMAKKIKGMIQQFRRDIVDVVSKDEAPNSVYQLSFYLFPLTHIDEKKKGP